MASNQFVILAIVAILLPTVAPMAMEYIVGDDKGWTINFDYQAWAKDKVFMVGDKLVFNYNATMHNVAKVSAITFANCTLGQANQILDTGNDVIELATPGKKWYICEKPDHCAKFGQKLVINVVSGAPVPAPLPDKNAAAFGAVMSVFQVVVAVMVAVAVIAVY